MIPAIYSTAFWCLRVSFTVFFWLYCVTTVTPFIEQLVSDCVKEVTRLLSIKQITTTAYHPLCNGLTEKFNGTMKLMLKRLCSEQPRQWHRFINPLLFAYHEVRQESTGFSPFELLYGRAVRGPMTILKELWTKEVEEPEVKNSYQYVFELREKLDETLKLAHSQLQKARDKGKYYYDRKTRVRKFQPGEKALVLPPRGVGGGGTPIRYLYGYVPHNGVVILKLLIQNGVSMHFRGVF